MLPDISHPVWMQIITGERRFQSTKPTLNLLVQMNKMSYERDPSPANVKALIAKTHSFFSLYQALFADEIVAILK